jgi:hypothetical protein
MKKFLILGTLFLLSSCATQTFHLNMDQQGSVPTKEVMQPFFVGGIGQEQEINAAQICGGAKNVVKVDTYISVIDGLLGGLSMGIFTPHQARVYCK